MAADGAKYTKEEPSAWDAFKLVQDSLLRVWAIFIQWFTWFFGAELLTLTWILGPTSVTPGGGLTSNATLAIALLWAFCSLLAMLVAGVVCVITYRAMQAMDRLSTNLPPIIASETGSFLAKWPVLSAGIGAGLALFAAFVVWIFLVLYMWR